MSNANGLTGKKLGELHQLLNAKYEKCLFPTMKCDHPAIRAHSVQNRNALQGIAEGGHVTSLKLAFKGGKPSMDFASVGINDASTFHGLCAKHDNDLFKPIDDNPIDPSCTEHLFLLAYRSVTRELHAVLKGASQMQTGYQQKIKSGVVSGQEPSQPGMEALEHLVKAYGTYEYRREFFDKCLEAGKFETIKHSKIEFEHTTAPFIATSSFFSADLKAWGEPFAGVAVNILPIAETRSLVVFSYAASHSTVVRKYLKPVMTGGIRKRLFELSILIVDRVENVFFRPSHVNGWPQEKRDFVAEQYGATINAGKPTRSALIDLFDVV